MQSARHGLDWGLWRRWVAANAFGELGLAAALVVGLSLAATVEARAGPWAAAAVAIAAGTLIEGLWVGLAQWWVLRRALPGLSRGAWLLATLIGGFVSWTFGMLPSTLMAGADQAGAAVAGVSGATELILAALLGAAVGPVLGIPQSVALRKHVPKAAWWIVANSAAWALGMPVVFAAMGGIGSGACRLRVVALAVFAAVAAGAVVGAVHGYALLRLLALRRATGKDAPPVR
jgi:hypothetical protein